MTRPNLRSLTVTATKDDKAKYYDANSKQFANLRKDINELIILVSKLCEQVVKNNGGCL